MPAVTYGDVKAAAERLAGAVRPVTVAAVDPDAFGGAEVYLALEFMQHTGSFKARGAANFSAALVEDGTMPAAGIVIATGGNADLGFAWAAGRYGVPVTVFLPVTTPPAKVARLRALGADVRLEGDKHADALAASRTYAERSGAIDAYASDGILTAAGSGTLLPEILAAVPELDTVVVAVGGGGMFAGVTAAADHHGIRVVAAEPEGSRALHAAIEADGIVDVVVESVAADSLGAHRIMAAALAWAQAADVDSVLVEDTAIVRARQLLWDNHHLAVEHGSATAFGALTSGEYRPRDCEKIAVVLCGANTDPADLAAVPANPH